jgi:UDP-2,3-diacylglucosamine hydrolase
LPNYIKSREREKKFVKWLDEISIDAKEIYLLGDIFDFWFEYKKVVPRGFTRLLGKLSEITDKGIPVYFLTGNHDMWIFDYLPEETGIIIIKGNLIRQFDDKKFFISHGDGLGVKSPYFKLLKIIFENKCLQWVFARFHPNFAIAVALRWSRASRYSKEIAFPYQGDEKEELVCFAKKYLEKEHIDYFITGHRHIPLYLKLKENSYLINTGEWIKDSHYAVYDGDKVILKKY